MDAVSLFVGDVQREVCMLYDDSPSLTLGVLYCYPRELSAPCFGYLRDNIHLKAARLCHIEYLGVCLCLCAF